VKTAIYAGIRVLDVDQFCAINCNADYNLYAGLLIHRTKQITIVGGSYSYNGHTAPTNGYGIAISHRYGTAIDNEGIYISGVKAEYNLRKGIDAHGGKALNING